MLFPTRIGSLRALGRKYKNCNVYIRKQGRRGEGKGMGYSNGSRSDQRQAITLDARLGTCRTQRCVLQVARVRKLDETLLTCQIEFQSRRRLCSTATRLRLGRLVSAAKGSRSHSVYRFCSCSDSRSRSRHQ